MENISKYIEEIKKYVNSHEDMTEELLIRYVYLDLGKRFAFNPEYLPFGNSKKRQEIYTNGVRLSELDKSFDTSYVICNAISKALEIVLKEFNVDIISIKSPADERRCPHVYNIVRTNDGKEHEIDLQEDMYYIKMRSRTRNYGLASRDKQEEMDLKLGYISKEEYYSDEYIYLLKSYVDSIESTYDKFKFIVENISAFNNHDYSYTDRQWFHMRVLEKFFDANIFNYQNDTGNIKMLNAYHYIDGKKKYVNAITYDLNNEIHIFLYNNQTGCYQEIEYNYFLNAIDKGLKLHNCKVKYLEKDYQRILNRHNNS